jgi:hypothetical protein
MGLDQICQNFETSSKIRFRLGRGQFVDLLAAAGLRLTATCYRLWVRDRPRS